MYIDVQWRVHVDRVLPKKLVVLRGAVHDGNEALQWDYHWRERAPERAANIPGCVLDGDFAHVPRFCLSDTGNLYIFFIDMM